MEAYQFQPKHGCAHPILPAKLLAALVSPMKNEKLKKIENNEVLAFLEYDDVGIG